MYAVEASDLRKRFKQVQAVDGVSLAVPEGQVCALLGPNGAGKTTTLMMLLGVTEPDEGSVRLLGHEMPEGRSAALGQVGFTASYTGLPLRTRVSEVLDVFATLYGAPRSRVSEVIEMFGLEPFLRRFSSQVSSGQRTLVGLAKAFLNRPRLLVLDEPTASLDPDAASRVRDVIRARHQEEGFTVIITSHNMSDVERLSTRVIFVAGGRIIADGAPSDITSMFGAGNLEETFITVAARSREART